MAKFLYTREFVDIFSLQPSKPSLNQSSLALAFEEDDGVKEKEVRREKSGDEDPVPSRAS